MPIEIRNAKRTEIQVEPDKIFVYGDNAVAMGPEPSAKEYRGETNTVAIPVLWGWRDEEASFFHDGHLKLVEGRIRKQFEKLENALIRGKIVVWPLTDIGTGRANLEKRAPKIWAYIQRLKNKLMELGPDITQIEKPRKRVKAKGIPQGVRWR